MQIEHISFDREVWEEAHVYEKRIRTFGKGSLGFFQDTTLIGFFFCELWHFETQYDMRRFKLSHDIARYHDLSGTQLYISSFAIDLAYRNILRGTQAFALAMDLMRDTYALQSAILLVSEQWIAARTIYERYGFEELQRVPHVFGDYDGIVMQMTLRYKVDQT